MELLKKRDDKKEKWEYKEYIWRKEGLGIKKKKEKRIECECKKKKSIGKRVELINR